MKRIILLISLFFLTLMPTVMAGPNAAIEKLGNHLYHDKNLSFNGTQSCHSCHHRAAGFADRTNLMNPYVHFVSTGADGESKGGRNAPTAAYAGFSPQLEKVEEGVYIGGLFWDGRADGSVLGDPLAEQAQGPPLNPVEMNMPDKQSIIDVIKASTYADLFIKIFGKNAFNDIDEAYDNFGRAIAAYERSIEVTKFSSKYDSARGSFTPAEERGLALFEVNCSQCHSTKTPPGAPAALFTSYGYANIGAPVNPLVQVGTDLGLGMVVGDSAQDGKFKIPTMRNIAMTPPYTHNRSFPTLLDIVSFINDSSGYDPDVDRNIDTRVGNMELSEYEIDDLIAFLLTLTDDY